jgi:hypothetical protein
MTRAVLLVWIVITTMHVCAQRCRAQQSSPPPTLDDLVERVRLADGEAGQNKPANGLYELRCQESGHRMRFQVQDGVLVFRELLDPAIGKHLQHFSSEPRAFVVRDGILQCEDLQCDGWSHSLKWNLATGEVQRKYRKGGGSGVAPGVMNLMGQEAADLPSSGDDQTRGSGNDKATAVTIAPGVPPPPDIKADNPFLKRDKAVFGWEWAGSWQYSPEFHEKQFTKRNLPLTPGHGMFAHELKVLHSRGLELHDIVIRINGKKIDDDKSYAAARSELRIGVPATVHLKRLHEEGVARKWKTIPVKLVPVSSTAVGIYQRKHNFMNRTEPALGGAEQLRQTENVVDYMLNKRGKIPQVFEDVMQDAGGLFKNLVAAVNTGDDYTIIQSLGKFSSDRIAEMDSLVFETDWGRFARGDTRLTNGQVLLAAWDSVLRSLGEDAIKGGLPEAETKSP